MAKCAKCKAAEAEYRMIFDTVKLCSDCLGKFMYRRSRRKENGSWQYTDNYVIYSNLVDRCMDDLAEKLIEDWVNERMP